MYAYSRINVLYYNYFLHSTRDALPLMAGCLQRNIRAQYSRAMNAQNVLIYIDHFVRCSAAYRIL